PHPVPAPQGRAGRRVSAAALGAAMQTPARVTSLDLLRDFRAALAGFRVEGQDALTAVELELRRASDWLAERRQFWQRQVRALQDEVTKAKSELSRRRM